MGRILTPLGVHRFLRKPFFMLYLAQYIKPAFSYCDSLDTDIVGTRLWPHILRTSSYVHFWRSSRVTTWFQWTELASLLLCQVCPIFGLFVHSPAPPLSSSFRSYLWGSLYLWHGYNLSNTQPVSPPSLPVKIIYKNGERTQLQLIYWQDLPSQNVNVSRAVNIFE